MKTIRKFAPLRRLLLAALALMVAAPLALAQEAELKFTIKGGNKSALPIAVVPFASVGDTGNTDIAAVIRSDLERSGQFNPMQPGDMPSQPSSFTAVNFKDWRVLGQENLVLGKVMASGDGGYVVEFRVIDVFKGNRAAGLPHPDLGRQHAPDRASHQRPHLRDPAPPQGRVRDAHRIRDGRARVGQEYRLQVADADGYDPHTILESKQPLMSPSWSPDGAHLAYVSFEDRNSAIYLQDIRTGKREKLVYGPGINSAPSFSPDGQRLVGDPVA